MEHTGLIEQAKEGLGEYRQALMAMHVPGSVDLKEVRSRLAARGLACNIPFVNLPYTPEHLGAVSRLKEAYPWTDPHVTKCIDDAHDKAVRLARGESILKVGDPIQFYAPLLGLIITTDEVAANIERYGEAYAQGLAHDYNIHEGGHGAFASLNEVEYHQPADTPGQVNVNGRLAISQAPYEVTLRPYKSTEPEYLPMWIDEAAVASEAAAVRADMHPASIPRKSFPWEEVADESFDIYDIQVPARYLVHSDQFPDVPGTIASWAAGITLDILADKLPKLMPGVRALSLGKTSVAAFHRDLCNGVGKELYTKMTSRQPYDTWDDILDQVLELK